MNSWTVQIYLAVALILWVAASLVWLPQYNFALQNTINTKVEGLHHLRELKLLNLPKIEYQPIQKRKITERERAWQLIKDLKLYRKLYGSPHDYELHGIPLDIELPSEKGKEKPLIENEFTLPFPLVATTAIRGSA